MTGLDNQFLLWILGRLHGQVHGQEAATFTAEPSTLHGFTIKTFEDASTAGVRCSPW